MKQYLDFNEVKISIREALVVVTDCRRSINRIRGTISNLPPGKLVYSTEKENCGKCLVRFYLNLDGKKSYLSRNSDMLYGLCRKRYLLLILRALEIRDALLLPGPECVRSVSNCRQDFDNTVDSIMRLLDVYIKGNLDIARIVLTPKQYRWFTGNYQKKRLDNAEFSTGMGIAVRSKSERDIGNAYESYAVPYHYEEQLAVNAARIVNGFENQLMREGIHGPICTMGEWSCFWHVPPEYEWMNMPGSIWRAYKPNTGVMRIYNDFHIMLADGELMVHEHEGIVMEFRYRCNASERVYVMLLTGAVSRRNLITTFESDVPDFKSVIRERILPRLWF